jgi:hypothetical protein
VGHLVEKEGEMRCCRSGFLTCAVTVMLLLSLTVVLVGCGGGKGGSGGGGAKDAVAMMGKLPKDARAFSFVDVKAIRADTDLNQAYNSIKDSLESEEGLGGGSGVSAEDVDSMVQGGSVMILEGRFDLGELRKGLEGKGYDDTEYKGVDTWEDDLSIALVSASCIVIGYDMESLKACIEVINGNGDSLQDDTNIQDLVGRLPSGIVIYSYSGEWEEYEGLENCGYSLVKKTADTMRVTAIYQFQDESAASAATGDIEKDTKAEIEGTTATNVAVTRDGKYVKATGDVEIDDMFEESDDGGTSDLEDARAELVTAQAAIEACLAEANASQLDASVAAWNGTSGKVKATVDSQTYDAADYLRGGEFEATYAVAIDGTITGGTNVSRSGVTWDSVNDTWVEEP